MSKRVELEIILLENTGQALARITCRRESSKTFGNQDFARQIAPGGFTQHLILGAGDSLHVDDPAAPSAFSNDERAILYACVKRAARNGFPSPSPGVDDLHEKLKTLGWDSLHAPESDDE